MDGKKKVIEWLWKLVFALADWGVAQSRYIESLEKELDYYREKNDECWRMDCSNH